MLMALAAAPAAMAHTAFTNLYVDGVDSGDAVAMRMNPNPSQATFPLNDLSSNSLACNVDGDKGVSRVQAVKDGATLTFEFRGWTDDPSKVRLDRGHKGPCAVYLKKVDSAINDPGYGDGWFKLYDDGYDASSGQWCTDKLIDNNGLFSIALPKGLQGGYYLARPEILALHNANAGDPQFYAGCAQIFLESSGDLGPESTVSIPGYVKAGEDSVSFDIYNTDNSKYTLPGPPVAKLVSASSALSDAQPKQTEGQRPADCICENGNWCGKEVDEYSDEASCWKSAEQCWTQADDCWNSAPPTGGAGCKIWQSKCENLKNQCSSGNFQGPPNKGKDLTPRHKTIDVGAVAQPEGVVVGETPKTEAPKSSAAPESKTSAPAQAKPSVTPSAAPAPKPAPYEPEGETETEGDDSESENAYDTETPAVETPKPTSAIPPPEEAPAPTPEPTVGSCQEGYPCVTKWETQVKTETVYVTMGYDSYKRRGIHARRL